MTNYEYIINMGADEVAKWLMGEVKEREYW